jgi:hypothetical protein
MAEVRPLASTVRRPRRRRAPHPLHEWQSLCTRRDREIELTIASHTYEKPGRYTIAVKVVDILGNDTMSLARVTVG